MKFVRSIKHKKKQPINGIKIINNNIAKKQITLITKRQDLNLQTPIPKIDAKPLCCFLFIKVFYLIERTRFELVITSVTKFTILRFNQFTHLSLC